MSEHRLVIENSDDEGPRLRLECSATPDAPCRMQPEGEDSEWIDGDPGLTPGHHCWAVGWWEDIPESVELGTATWPSIPVTIDYNEGVIPHPAKPQEPLDWGESDE